MTVLVIILYWLWRDTKATHKRKHSIGRPTYDFRSLVHCHHNREHGVKEQGSRSALCGWQSSHADPEAERKEGNRLSLPHRSSHSSCQFVCLKATSSQSFLFHCQEAARVSAVCWWYLGMLLLCCIASLRQQRMWTVPPTSSHRHSGAII